MEALVHLLMVKSGIDTNLRTHSGNTPLSQAASNGHEAIVRLLTLSDRLA